MFLAMVGHLTKNRFASYLDTGWLLDLDLNQAAPSPFCAFAAGRSRYRDAYSDAIRLRSLRRRIAFQVEEATAWPTAI